MYRVNSFRELIDDFVTSSQLSLSESLTQLSEILLEQKLVQGSIYEINQALVFLLVFVEALAQFYPKIEKMILVKDLKEILNRTVCNNEIKTTKLIKFYYCCLCSVAYDSPELPVKPECNVTNNRILPFGGSTYKAILRRLHKHDKKAITFSSTVYLSRYAAIPVPNSFIKEAEESYVKRLTRIPEEKEYDLTSIQSSLSCFPKRNLEQLFKSSVKCLSTSAVSEKHALGQYGVVFDKCPKVEYSTPLGQEYSGIAPAPFFAYAFVGKELTGTATHLPEPLKVRSITTASAYEFLAGKPFQATISSSMKKNTNLVFGREVSEKDINELVYQSRQYYGEDEELFFLSADYSSATDNLSPLLSEKVDKLMLKEINLDFPIPTNPETCWGMWKAMALIFNYLNKDYCGPKTSEQNWVRVSTWFYESISTSNLEKENISDIRSRMWKDRKINLALEKGHVINQSFGQMMGDIKSFPVLCAINLSLWMYCNDNKVIEKINHTSIELLDIHQFEKVRIKAPCLINGDDFLSFCPMRIVTRFKEAVSLFDLELSIGKTFVSKMVAQINSTNFILNFHTDMVKKVNPLPLHAVFSIPENMPVDQSINYAIEHQPLLLNRLIFFNKRRIKEVTNDGMVNLCIPTELGGLGVKAVPKKVTVRQLLIARDNIKRLKNPLVISYQWLPYGKICKKDSKKYEIHVYGSVPKGKGVTTDKFGREHVLQTYSASQDARHLQKDDWLASLSKQKFKAKQGVMKIKNHFHDKFVTKSARLLKRHEQSKDQRLPDLEKLIKKIPTYKNVLVKNNFRRFDKKSGYIDLGTSVCGFQSLNYLPHDSYQDTIDEKQEVDEYEKWLKDSHEIFKNSQDPWADWEISTTTVESESESDSMDSSWEMSRYNPNNIKNLGYVEKQQTYVTTEEEEN